MKTLADRALDALRALSESPSEKAKETPKGLAQAGTPTVSTSLAPCGEPHCAGCYEVEPGRRIHPRKSGQEWDDWLARWQPKSEATKQSARVRPITSCLTFLSGQGQFFGETIGRIARSAERGEPFLTRMRFLIATKPHAISRETS